MKKYVFKKKRYFFIIGLIDFLGNLLFRPSNKKIYLNNINKILVVRLDHLGDIVSSIPVYKQLKQKLPNCRISVLTTPQGEEILRFNPYIDNIITFCCPWFARGKKEYYKIFTIRNKILQEKFDCALELRGDIRNILFLRFCRVKDIIGYGITGGGFLLSKEMPYQDNFCAVDKNLFIMKGLGLDYYSDFPRIYWNETEKETRWAQQILDNDKPVIVYHPDAGTPAKKWPQKKFLEVINKVEKIFSVKTVLIGKEKISELSETNFLCLFEKTTLRQMIHILRVSKLLISNDSGPAHIAAAVGIPVVVIWSGTADPQIWAPRGKNVKIVRKDVDCQFCERKRCSSLECLKKISVEDVFLAVEKVFNENWN